MPLVICTYINNRVLVTFTPYLRLGKAESQEAICRSVSRSDNPVSDVQKDFTFCRLLWNGKNLFYTFRLSCPKLGTDEVSIFFLNGRLHVLTLQFICPILNLKLCKYLNFSQTTDGLKLGTSLNSSLKEDYIEEEMWMLLQALSSTKTVTESAICVNLAEEEMTTTPCNPYKTCTCVTVWIYVTAHIYTLYPYLIKSCCLSPFVVYSVSQGHLVEQNLSNIWKN